MAVRANEHCVVNTPGGVFARHTVTDMRVCRNCLHIAASLVYADDWSEYRVTWRTRPPTTRKRGLKSHPRGCVAREREGGLKVSHLLASIGRALDLIGQLPHRLVIVGHRMGGHRPQTGGDVIQVADLRTHVTLGSSATIAASASGRMRNPRSKKPAGRPPRFAVVAIAGVPIDAHLAEALCNNWFSFGAGDARGRR